MNLRTKIGTLIGAAALVAAMAPTSALAAIDPLTDQTTSTDVAPTAVTITGLEPGDTVGAWQIFDADIDEHNNLTYTAPHTLPEAYDTTAELAAVASDDDGAYHETSAAHTAADKLAAALCGSAADVSVTDGGAGDNNPSNGAVTMNLGSGYWLVRVTSTNGETKVYQNMLVNATPVANADKTGYNSHAAVNRAAKTTPVTITKEVQSADDSWSHKTDDYCAGQHVPFRVTVPVPSYPADSTNATFVIGDTPSTGLLVDTDTLAVTVNGTPITESASTFTWSKKTTGGYELTFAKDWVLAHGGQSVVITYTSTLTTDAFSVEGDVTDNTATVKFNPNPYSDSTAEPDDTTQVQTYGYVFQKEDDNHGALAGAEFTLYAASDVVNGEPKDGATPLATSTSTKVGDHAYVWFEDLGEGSYVAIETTVPAGYQAAAPVSITINAQNCQSDNPATTDVVENNYQVRENPVIDGDEPQLPITGGAGTVALTAAGVALIAFGTISVARSRKSEN